MIVLLLILIVICARKKEGLRVVGPYPLIPASPSPVLPPVPHPTYAVSRLNPNLHPFLGTSTTPAYGSSDFY